MYKRQVLKQDQNAYDAYNVMDTVIMGNQRLYEVGREKEAIYAKEEMTDEDGMRACELEEESVSYTHLDVYKRQIQLTYVTAAV